MAGHKFGCSEAVVLAFRESFPDHVPSVAVAASSAFRGGMGGAGCTCGALAAGQIILGLFFGYHGDANGEQDPENVKKSRTLYKELHDRFVQANGAACCRVLTKGLDSTSPVRKNGCLSFVRQTSEVVGEIIARETAV